MDAITRAVGRRMNMDERVCGYCAYHKKDEKDWMCVNERSDNCGEYTSFSERCCDFEERKVKNVSK